jgi:hypothetical protein
VDGFCEDGSPEVPFTTHRAAFMRQREEACCWRLGEWGREGWGGSVREGGVGVGRWGE